MCKPTVRINLSSLGNRHVYGNTDFAVQCASCAHVNDQMQLNCKVISEQADTTALHNKGCLAAIAAIPASWPSACWNDLYRGRPAGHAPAVQRKKHPVAR